MYLETQSSINEDSLCPSSVVWSVLELELELEDDVPPMVEPKMPPYM